MVGSAFFTTVGDKYVKSRSRNLLLLTAVLVFSFRYIAWTQASTESHSDSAKSVTTPTAEDLNSLSLAGSQLRMQAPLLGEKDDLPQFTRELLQVQWRSGDPIYLYVIRPNNVAKPPVILYLYTYPSETDRFRNDTFGFDVTRNGFAAVGFVSALTGQRYHSRPMKEWFVSELQESLVKSVHDVQMVLNYLDTRDDLDTSHIAMFGEGSGGTIAILSAATDPRIKVVDVLDPWADWPDWMAKSEIIPEQERPNYVKPDFLKKIAPLDPLEWLPRLKSQHVRIQQVMDDGTTPKVAKQKLESIAPTSAQLVHYDGGPDFFRAVSGGRLFQWMKDQIRPASALQPPNPNPKEADSEPAGTTQND
jgi:hypothetical protein